MPILLSSIGVFIIAINMIDQKMSIHKYKNDTLVAYKVKLLGSYLSGLIFIAIAVFIFI